MRTHGVFISTAEWCSAAVKATQFAGVPLLKVARLTPGFGDDKSSVCGLPCAWLRASLLFIRLGHTSHVAAPEVYPSAS